MMKKARLLLLTLSLIASFQLCWMLSSSSGTETNGKENVPVKNGD